MALPIFHADGLRWCPWGWGIAAMVIVGCSAPLPADADPAPVASPAAVPRLAQAQVLPLSAVAELPDGTRIWLEVAATPQQQSLGLMYRATLPDNQGMAFPFDPPRGVNFWMRNVPVPLDMVFLYEGTVQAIAAEVPPCTTLTCPTYGPDNQLIDYVIELRSGRAAELGLAPGDDVHVTPLDAPLPPNPVQP